MVIFYLQCCNYSKKHKVTLPFRLIHVCLEIKLLFLKEKQWMNKWVSRKHEWMNGEWVTEWKALKVCKSFVVTKISVTGKYKNVLYWHEKWNIQYFQPLSWICLQNWPVLFAQRGKINSECLNVKPAINSLSCSKPQTKYIILQLLISKREREEEREDPR